MTGENLKNLIQQIQIKSYESRAPLIFFWICVFLILYKTLVWWGVRLNLVYIELNWIILFHVEKKIHVVSLDHITKYMSNSRQRWWWQFWCKDAWTPEFTDRFGWPVKTKLTQEELLVCICVGPLINCQNPFEDVSEYNFVPSEVLISSDYQDEDLALKSPVITDTVGLHLLMSLNCC